MSLRIRLLQDLPIEKKHGCVKGEEYDVKSAGGPVVIVSKLTGEDITVLKREFELIDHKHTWYVEDKEEFNGEGDGQYVVMCSTCGEADKWCYQESEPAYNRLKTLQDKQ